MRGEGTNLVLGSALCRSAFAVSLLVGDILTFESRVDREPTAAGSVVLCADVGDRGGQHVEQEAWFAPAGILVSPGRLRRSEASFAVPVSIVRLRRDMTSFDGYALADDKLHGWGLSSSEGWGL